MATFEFPYRPLDQKGWRMAMGLRPLDPSKWLEADDRRESELALKHDLLASSYDVVVAVNEEGDEASAELLSEIRRSLRDHHPEVAPRESTGEHPIVEAARLVQEDLCVMVRSDEWRLRSACVCFPSRWNLAAKIGRTIDEIHGPVPLYDERLSGPTNAFFDRLDAERSFWRLNWTFIDNPALHQPSVVRQDPRDDLADWYFRVERQTLRRLARSDAVVFTIRNYVASAQDLCDRYEDFGPMLLRSLDTAPGSVQDYKGWRGVADRLRSSLSQT